MARQTGVLQFQGTIGNLTFYKTKHGYHVRKKGGVSGKVIKSSPAFVRTRENIAEFTRAAKASKLFRTAFVSLIRRAGDNRLSNRLTSIFLRVLQADEVNPRGQRNVHHGETRELEGFEFNQNSSLSNRLLENFTASIDRATGRMVVDIPAFSPARMISAPEGATHLRLFSGGGVFDFESGTFDVAKAESPALSISQKNIEPIELIMTVSPDSSGPLFLLLGVEFVQSVNWRENVLNDGGYNAMAVVKVSER